MCGSATLATEESSTTMKVASITDPAMVQGFAAGFQACSSASVSRCVWLAALIRFSDPAGQDAALDAAGGELSVELSAYSVQYTRPLSSVLRLRGGKAGG